MSMLPTKAELEALKAVDKEAELLKVANPLATLAAIGAAMGGYTNPVRNEYRVPSDPGSSKKKRRANARRKQQRESRRRNRR